MTAAALYKDCSAWKKTCASYMRQTFDWMWTHPDVYGALCVSPAMDAAKQQLKVPLSEDLVRSYWVIGHQTWARTANAHDAAIWSIQAHYDCGTGGHLASPGDPDFPTKLRSRQEAENDLLTKLRLPRRAASAP